MARDKHKECEMNDDILFSNPTVSFSSDYNLGSQERRHE